MLGRVPPALLALVVVAVVLGAGAIVFAVTGGGGGRRVADCTAAQSAGPYGCVTFVSVAPSSEPSSSAGGGAITFRIEQAGSGERLLWSASGDCRGTAPVQVSASRWRFGTAATSSTCSAGSAGALAQRLFRGTIPVTDPGDTSLLVGAGAQPTRFAEVIAPGP